MDRKSLNKKRERRSNRSRAKIGKGTGKRPRLSVFRSNRRIYAQVIDDTKGETLVSASSHKANAENKTEAAREVGKLIADKANEAGINKVIFDKSHYNYQGRVKTLAEAARKEGLKF